MTACFLHNENTFSFGDCDDRLCSGVEFDKVFFDAITEEYSVLRPRPPL